MSSRPKLVADKSIEASSKLINANDEENLCTNYRKVNILSFAITILQKLCYYSSTLINSTYQ